MTQSNQSELEEATPEYRFGYDITKICLANGGVTEPMVEKLYDYITANYTPNSEVAERKRTAIFKTIQTLVKAGAISDRAASNALVLLTKLKEVK